MSSYDLTGRKALVTGGARGLGAGIAEALTKAGAAVVIGDVLEEAGKETAGALRDAGADAEFVKLDVTDDGNWAAAVQQSVDAMGGLDILVNNAGVEITSLIVDLDPSDVRRMLDVNVLGSSLGLKHGFRAMRPGGAGAEVARWSTSPPSPRRSRSPASRCIPRRSPRSTGSAALPPPNPENSVTGCASTPSSPA
ncbi:SDR family NAD(P)-dependent oxidoreductase [Saccharopolyspora gloriosae]|uniref:SDR family NAD(P)-dependent oxidoreductase n=1 Tax=Saccharopolyspora gloriosae TaxID=455344 RepID=UPI0037CCB4DF